MSVVLEVYSVGKNSTLLRNMFGGCMRQANIKTVGCGNGYS